MESVDADSYVCLPMNMRMGPVLVHVRICMRAYKARKHGLLVYHGESA